MLLLKTKRPTSFMGRNVQLSHLLISWGAGRVTANVDSCGQLGSQILLKLRGRHKWHRRNFYSCWMALCETKNVQLLVSIKGHVQLWTAVSCSDSPELIHSLMTRFNFCLQQEMRLFGIRLWNVVTREWDQTGINFNSNFCCLSLIKDTYIH